MSVLRSYTTCRVRVIPVVGVLGILIHVLLLVCIFHIYFQSPLIPNLRGHAPEWNGLPPADRVVLIVADGLRAHTFFEHLKQQAPFLSGLIDGGASWGVSHTHVPTESRPGHVAMVAGFPEDVSAITKGWKENTVPFDSVFNRSSYSFLWGSPDIVPLFANGDHSARVYADSYSAELEDFASADASQLDKWVFNKVQDFFSNISADYSSELSSLVHGKGHIYFLHLLGLDTNGHGHKPHSQEYIQNIAVVDRGVEQLQATFSRVFGPEHRTAFVFTADHGMTDWGSHGAGTDHETMTPLLAWGSGVSRGGAPERSSGDWWVHNRMRHNIQQIDLAPYISSLLGHVFPTNSLGRVPLSLLNATVRYKYQAAAANFAQIREQLLASRALRMQQTLFGREPTDFEKLTTARLASIEKTVHSLVVQQRLEAATELLMQELPVLRQALLYWHRYEQSTQTACIVLVILTWVMLLGALGCRPKDMHTVDIMPGGPLMVIMVLLLVLASLKHLHCLNHVLYCLPVYLLQLTMRLNGEQWMAYTGKQWTEMLGRYALVAISALMFTVLFETRWLLSVLLLGVGANCWCTAGRYSTTRATVAWLGTCLLAALFPLAPTVGKGMHPVIHLTPSIILIVVVAGLLWRYTKSSRDLPMPQLNAKTPLCNMPFTHQSVQRFTSVWLCMAVLNTVCIITCDYYLALKQPVPLTCNLWSWLCLCACPIMGVFAVPHIQPSYRALSLSVCLYLPYAIMSLAQETAFMVVYMLMLCQWVYMQWQHNTRECATGDNQQWTLVLTAMCLLLFAFFGTGNLASLNSFDPSFLRCLLTTFSPWLMAVLLVLKVLCPMFVLALAVSLLFTYTSHHATRLAAKILQLADIMALVCFMQLKDDGSWLEIGMSISHYLLAVLLPLAFAVLCLLAYALLHCDLTHLCFWNKQRKHLI